MSRRAKMYLPGHTYHIVQRGNKRAACFVEPENYPYYLELWKVNNRGQTRMALS
jgi:REP element-mobilizing transposase RayT